MNSVQSDLQSNCIVYTVYKLMKVNSFHCEVFPCLNVFFYFYENVQRRSEIILTFNEIGHQMLKVIALK